MQFLHLQSVTDKGVLNLTTCAETSSAFSKLFCWVDYYLLLNNKNTKWLINCESLQSQSFFLSCHFLNLTQHVLYNGCFNQIKTRACHYSKWVWTVTLSLRRKTFQVWDSRVSSWWCIDRRWLHLKFFKSSLISLHVRDNIS